jgi:ABC-2 type transport system ATP-binding protein
MLGEKVKTVAKIEVRDVTLQFRKTTALKGVSINFEENKIYGLLGRNGAGKTSLLSLLASFRRPTFGTVLVDGKNPFEDDDLMQKISLIWDKKMDDEANKVAAMLKFVSYYRANWDEDYAKHLTKLFDLPLHKPVNELSQGMRAIMNVIIGLAGRAEVTIFDEAYLGMDAAYRKLFFQELLEDYMHNPRTFILSTHYISELEHMLEDVIILHNGGLLLHSKTEELLNSGVAITGGQKEVDRFVLGKELLSVQSLGNTKSAVLYGEISFEDRMLAAQEGLAIERPPLQDLFIYLTSRGEEQDGA